MVTSTQTFLNDASLLVAQTVFTDEIKIYNVGEPVTNGTKVTRVKTAVGDPVPALVQTTTLATAAESLVDAVYSVKVARGVNLVAGQAVEVTKCAQEPALVGKTLLLDKVSLNGWAVLRKATARDYNTVNQEGKGEL